MLTKQYPKVQKVERLASELRRLTEDELDTLELLLDEKTTTELLQRQRELETGKVKPISEAELRRRLTGNDAD